MKLLHRFAFISALLFAGAAVAQQAVTERVQFPAGQSGTTIRGSLQGDQSILYLLGAAAGQRMVVNMTTSNPSTYFNIFAPGDAPGRSAAMYVAATSGLTYNGVLPTSGDYMVQVFINRNAARRGESTTYTLDIRIDGAAGAGQDFADGLSGGPDYWEVTGVSGSLNIRTAPSTSAPVRMGLLRGTVVRNLGCRMNEGRRWCEVAQLGGGATGWAAGEYLREAAEPSQTVIPPSGFGAAGSGGDSLVAAAEQACLRGVTQVTNNANASVLRSSFSEAGTEVIVGVGPQRAPWRCIAYRDGTTAGIMSLTNEGAAVSPPPSNTGSVTRVTGVPANELLNVRSGPGTANRVVGALGNGDNVRVLNCQNVSGARWCEIEMMTDMRERGWVNARYLR